jgi:hypothetical protein
MVFSDGSIVNVVYEDNIKVEHVTDPNMVKKR